MRKWYFLLPIITLISFIIIHHLVYFKSFILSLSLLGDENYTCNELTEMIYVSECSEIILNNLKTNDSVSHYFLRDSIVNYNGEISQIKKKEINSLFNLLKIASVGYYAETDGDLFYENGDCCFRMQAIVRDLEGNVYDSSEFVLKYRSVFLGWKVKEFYIQLK